MRKSEPQAAFNLGEIKSRIFFDKRCFLVEVKPGGDTKINQIIDGNFFSWTFFHSSDAYFREKQSPSAFFYFQLFNPLIWMHFSNFEMIEVSIIERHSLSPWQHWCMYVVLTWSEPDESFHSFIAVKPRILCN